ncbi:MAG TPA: alpha/beta hydrolase [Kofleriaceae bacterium]|nr:alpha/beta hydrolase [Kofleriaceae bacterium]
MRAVERAAALLLAARGIRGRRIETDVASHHVYLADGRGALPPLVIVHGLADSAASAAFLMLRLRRRTRRIAAVESAGHGLSGSPRGEYTIDRHRASMTRVLDAIIDEPAILVGNSLGGATAIHYALERPDKVRALLLTSPAGGVMDEAVLEDLRRAFSPRTVADARRLVDRLFHRRSPLAGLVARVVLARAASPAVRDLVRTLAPADAFTPEQLGRLSVPVHIMWGRSERVLPPAMLAYFRAHLPPGAVFSEPDALGHCPHLDDPARMARLIVDFAELHAGRPAPAAIPRAARRSAAR